MESILLENGTLRFTADAYGFDTNKDKPLVICLHGFPDNKRSFRHQLAFLVAAGFRVVTPTLRGYEPSSQPEDQDYSVASLARDVIAWIDQLGEQKVHLVGHDWGAVITYAAGALAPERFYSLTTLAVPHGARFIQGIRKVPSQLLKSWYMSFFQVRGISEFMVQRQDWSFLGMLWRQWSPDFVLPDEEWEQLRQTFEAPGVKRAMLSYYRQNVSPSIMLGFKQTEASLLTSVPVPTLAITGSNDGCIDTRIYAHTFFDEDFPKGYRVERIHGAGHFCHQEKPEQINQLLRDWLQNHCA